MTKYEWNFLNHHCESDTDWLPNGRYFDPENKICQDLMDRKLLSDAVPPELEFMEEGDPQGSPSLPSFAGCAK